MCGIIGILGNHHVATDIHDGLLMLQHRGQDSAGIATYDGMFHIKKGNGLVQEVFKQEDIRKLLGNIGIGHTRYPTAGNYGLSEAQPFYVNSPFGMVLVHNGNLTNYDKLKKELLETESRHLNTTSDSELLLNIVAAEIRKLNVRKLTPNAVFEAMSKVFGRIKGSYSVVMLIGGQGMLAFRDPHGIRPLIVGLRRNTFGKEYIVASESVAFGILGFKPIRDIKPGEAVFIDMKTRRMHKRVCVKGKLNPCIFEYVYLARPDSILDKVIVYKSRLRMGRKLAKQIKAAKLKIDVVVPVPDTARPAAITLANILKIRYREGLVKNRYIARTFIMPDQSIRRRSIRYKFNPMEMELRNKNVLLVEDSIVRGNTSRKIIEIVREAGAKKVYFASYAPPLKYPCVYGVDIPSRGEFIAFNLTIDEIAKAIGADKLFYQKMEDFEDCIKEGNPKIKRCCKACFDGDYITPEVNEEVLCRANAMRRDEKKKLEDEKSVVSDDQLALL